MVDSSTKIFHESWYRIANQKVCLRPSVRIFRQYYRGAKWFVFHDPFSNQFYRLPQVAYDFVSRLSHNKTIETVWEECLRRDPDNAPGQGEVIELMAQLYQANMLHYSQAQDSSRLFERDRKRKKQHIKTTLFNILYLKIPLFDPEPILKVFEIPAKIILSKGFLVLWLGLLIYAGKLALDNFEQIKDGTQAAFAPSNLFLLYMTGVVIKAIHEFGHSIAVKRYGGEVHTIGLMFMLLAPLPYMDATASWSFRSKWQRILVASAGMFFEFFLASIAIIVWSNVGGGPVKAIAYNAMTIASITTLLFNINPLMKFDGYYILCDLIDMPNLQQHAQQHVKYLLERYAFRKTDAHTPANSWKDSCILAVYGITSSLYKVILFSGIMIAISQHYLLLALIMGLFMLFTWAILPIVRFLKYLFGPQLARVRSRALFLSFAVFLLLIGTLGFIPIPETFTAPGVVQASLDEFTINQTSGIIRFVKAVPGQTVLPGDTLLILENPELANQLNETQASLRESQSKFRLAMVKNPEDMEPIVKKISVLQQDLEKLLRDQNNLLVRANIKGIWVSPDAKNLLGKWISKGDSLGEVIDTTNFRFVAAIPQDEVSRLFAKPSQSHSVKLKGNAFSEIYVDSISVIPMDQNRLPSIALGWYGGGDVEMSGANGSQQETAEPFYEVQARITSNPDHVPLLQGRSGKIRFHLGYRPLLPQLWRKFQQALQKYYRI